MQTVWIRIRRSWEWQKVSYFLLRYCCVGFLCARLLPHKYNYMEKGILAGAAEIAEIAVAANLLAVLGMFSLYALSAVLFVSAGICLWIVCKREKVQEASGKMSRWDVAAVALLLISFCLCFFFPTKYMPASVGPGSLSHQRCAYCKNRWDHL